MPRRTDAFRGLAQASRLKVLHAILDHPGIPLAEISEQTGLHENTLRDHVRVLEAEGFIRAETEHRATRGRPRTVYRAVAGEVTHAVAEQRIRDAKHHGDLLRQLVPDAATTLETDAAHQIDVLYEHLDDVGLEPDIDETELTVELTPCPFHDLVESNPQIACAVHEKLIRNILEQAGGPVALDRLLPYTTAHSCRAHLTMRAAAEPTS